MLNISLSYSVKFLVKISSFLRKLKNTKSVSPDIASSCHVGRMKGRKEVATQDKSKGTVVKKDVKGKSIDRGDKNINIPGEETRN